MSRTPVPFAPDTLESIRRAFRVASDRRHDLVSLEHMLHALIEDPQAREILTRCRVDLTQLKRDRKSTRLNSSHSQISYAVFCLKKKKKNNRKVTIMTRKTTIRR